LVERIQQIQVIDAQSYERAGEELVKVKAYKKRVRDHFRPHKKAADKLHSDLCADEKRHLRAPEAVESLLEGRMLAWKEEEERKAEEERRAAEAEERRKAEDAQIAQAEDAKARGDEEAAEAILEEAPRPMPAPRRRAAPKLAGLSARKNWTYEVVDATKIPREYLKVDTTKIGQIVRAMKQQAEKTIPGIRVFARDGLAGR
jgi:hypothetical protein